MPNASNGETVVVTGIGAVTCLAPNANDTASAMVNGTSGISIYDVDEFKVHPDDAWQVKIAGQVKDWDPASVIDAKEAKRLDRFSHLGIAAGIEAVQHAGIQGIATAPDRMGVVIGSGVGGISTIENATLTLASKGPKRVSPFTVPRLMANAVSGDLSIRFGLEGPSGTHATACASSGHSIADAINYIRTGRADVMLAGGAEAAITPICIAAFTNMKALSTRNEAPTKASRPFDTDRDGFVLSEGAAVVVLESESHAKQRGANILATLAGAATSSDGHHITAPDPNGKGAAAAMKEALADAQLNATDVDYINAHGTSTPLGDAAEISAVLNLFGDHARKSAGGKLLLSSTKSMHGHGLGASGAIEMLACLSAINGTVPPTINLDNQDDSFDIDLVPNTAREATVNVALNNTFGFGGHNVSLVVTKYQG